MMETIEPEGLGDQARWMLEELMEMTRLKPGQILVVDCSPNEIDSFEIGFHSSTEIGIAVYMTLYQELKPREIYLAAQCCEHLNRASVLETEAVRAHGYEPVNAAPQLKAGSSFVAAVYATLEHPVTVEHIRAHVGVGISDTLIGMHMKDMAVPIRTKTKEIGSAHVVCTRTRPEFISSIRIRYDEENM